MAPALFRLQQEESNLKTCRGPYFPPVKARLSQWIVRSDRLLLQSEMHLRAVDGKKSSL